LAYAEENNDMKRGLKLIKNKVLPVGVEEDFLQSFVVSFISYVGTLCCQHAINHNETIFTAVCRCRDGLWRNKRKIIQFISISPPFV
jgi:hypothetical protein